MVGVLFDVHACNRGWHQDASSQKQSETQLGSSVFDTVAFLEHPHPNGPLLSSYQNGCREAAAFMATINVLCQKR
jgi:hypothetical protein